MFRLTIAENQSRIRVEGAVHADDARALHDAVASLRGGALVEIDLRGVTYIDAVAAGTLRDLRDAGFPLRGAAPLVRMLIGEDSRSHNARTNSEGEPTCS